MDMKKLASIILSFALICSFSSAFAAVPAKDSLQATRQATHGEQSSFTAESCPEVWITPAFDEHIITGIDPEKYPSKFLHFTPPANSVLYSFDDNKAVYIDHEARMFYNYYAHDSASFELFLEKADTQNILADGSDEKLAMYVQPDSNRAYALISIEDMFFGTSKVEILLDNYSGEVTASQLKQLIQAEAERVTAEMQAETLEGYWSDGAFKSIQISAKGDPVQATINTSGLIVTVLEGNTLETKRADGRMVYKTEVALDGYSYAHSKEDATDATLDDGTPYKRYSSDYTSYASFTVLEEGNYGPLYLTIKIDTAADSFPQELEKIYALVTVEQ